jgi:hypothetical protein
MGLPAMRPVWEDVVTLATVTAKRILRAMSGETKSLLVQADDDRFYVMKCGNNPQGGTRTLINELVSGLLMREAGIAAPKMALLRVEESLGDAAAPAGLHFGSEYPGRPGEISVYDFLPETLLKSVFNREEFCGALVMDKWLSNRDGRQAVFYRAPRDHAFIANRWLVKFIDNGLAFQGAEWTFRDSPCQGVYAMRSVYGASPSTSDFAPWLKRVADIPRGAFEAIYRSVPQCWIGSDEQELERLLERLEARRVRLRGLIQESLDFFAPRRMPPAMSLSAMPRVSEAQSIRLAI